MPVNWGDYGDGLVGTPDGDYYFEIEKVDAKESPKGGNIVTMKLQIVGGEYDGNALDRSSFIKDGDGMKRFGDDLKRLGFPAGGWWDAELAKTDKGAAAAKFGALMDKALACLPGLRFKGKKATNKQGDKEYVNVYINERGTDDGRPAVLDEAAMKAIAEKPEF